MAASTGQTEKFEQLFETEDEKNPCNAEGYTPFLLAARKGHFQICDFALQKVKDLNIDLGKNFLMFRQFQDRLGGTYGKNTQFFFAFGNISDLRTQTDQTPNATQPIYNVPHRPNGPKTNPTWTPNNLLIHSTHILDQEDILQRFDSCLD